MPQRSPTLCLQVLTLLSRAYDSLRASSTSHITKNLHDWALPPLGLFLACHFTLYSVSRMQLDVIGLATCVLPSSFFFFARLSSLHGSILLSSRPRPIVNLPRLQPAISVAERPLSLEEVIHVLALTAPDPPLTLQEVWDANAAE